MMLMPMLMSKGHNSRGRKGQGEGRIEHRVYVFAWMDYTKSRIQQRARVQSRPMAFHDLHIYRRRNTYLNDNADALVASMGFKEEGRVITTIRKHPIETFDGSGGVYKEGKNNKTYTESLELRREPPGNPESELKDELIGEAGGINERLLLAIGKAELALPGRLNSSPWTLASNERPDAAWG